MIINIPLQIDEKNLEEVVARDYENKIIKEIITRIENVLKSKSPYYQGTPKDGMRVIIEEEVDQYLDEYRNEIIEIAGKHLADRLTRTKRAKELLEENKNA